MPNLFPIFWFSKMTLKLANIFKMFSIMNYLHVRLLFISKPAAISAGGRKSILNIKVISTCHFLCVVFPNLATVGQLYLFSTSLFLVWTLTSQCSQKSWFKWILFSLSQLEPTFFSDKLSTEGVYKPKRYHFAEFRSKHQCVIEEHKQQSFKVNYLLFASQLKAWEIPLNRRETGRWHLKWKRQKNCESKRDAD